MRKIRVFDSTLRDGSHANGHNFTEKQVKSYCNAIDSVGLEVLFIGHGNGLGASSAQIGFSKVDDVILLNTAREHLRNTKLGAYLIPGFGTIRDNIIPAIKSGVKVFEIGCNCTEADISKEHIEYIRKNDLEVYGTLMMYHMTDTETIVENAKKMEDYGANGVIIMDSAGASTKELVEETFYELSQKLEIPIGFHAHNNLGMAVANTYTAICNGATIIDGTMRGYGAGAGNCQLEAICGLLDNKNVLDVDLLKLLNASEVVMDQIMHKPMGIDPISMISRVAGVFSAFKEHAIRAGKFFMVDPKEILLEVGKRKAIGGQEDIVIEVAKNLADKKVK